MEIMTTRETRNTSMKVYKLQCHCHIWCRFGAAVRALDRFPPNYVTIMWHRFNFLTLSYVD